MTEERIPALGELETWLASIGVKREMVLGSWKLSTSEVVSDSANRSVLLAFTNLRAPRRVIRVRLLHTDARRPAFARTASLDLSHEALPEALMPAAGRLLRVLHAMIAPRDDGALTLPTDVATGSAAPTTSARQVAAAPAANGALIAPALIPTGGDDRPTDATAARGPEPSVVSGSDTEGVLAFPTPDHCNHLERTVELPAEIREAFRRDGHVVVRGALDQGMLLAARAVVEDALAEALEGQWQQHTLPVGERTESSGYTSKPITRLGRGDAAIRRLVFSPRLAKLAADLMGVSRVRLFCEDWFVKEPGADRTPWHQDSGGMPFDAEATITVWIPFQPIDDVTGLLRFARGSHRFGVQPVGLLEPDASIPAGTHEADTREAIEASPPVTVARPQLGDTEDRALAFHVVSSRNAEHEPETAIDPMEAAFDAIIQAHDWPIDVSPPMLVGDVSFHEGSTIHGGLPNNSRRRRLALAVHCFADGARLKEPTTAAMRNYRQMWAADVAVGEPAVSRFWPLIYGGEESAVDVPSSTSVRTIDPRQDAAREDTSHLPTVSAVIHYASNVSGRVRAGPTSAVGESAATLVLEPHVMQVRDARSIRDRLSFACEGFILASHTSAIAVSPELRHLNRERRVESPAINLAYHAEMAHLTRVLTGARDVLPQRTLLIVRSSQRARERTWAGPSTFAHIDFTETSAHQFLHLIQSWEGCSIRPFRRFAIYQTWRMTIEPPQDNLLALCDGRSVSPDDMMVIDTVVGPEEVAGNKFETKVSRFNPAHRWFYFSNMRPDEVLLFKAFDSADPTVNTALHAAFDDPSAPADANPRASVETRLFAFFD